MSSTVKCDAPPPATREEDAHHLPLGAERHREGVAHGEARHKGIAGRGVRGAAIRERAALAEGAAHDPLAGSDGKPTEIVAPEAPRGGGHERRTLGVEHEQHRSVGVEQPRRAVHHEAEDLAGRQPRGGRGENLLYPDQRRRIHGADDVSRWIRLAGGRGLAGLEPADALAETFQRAADLRDGLAHDRRRPLRRGRVGSHG